MGLVPLVLPPDRRPNMPTTESLPIISHAIQLAIAPVFLMTGIASMLGVMANRLARVIDRARLIEKTWTEMDEAQRNAARLEIADLERRRRLASWSINFCASAALLVCVVIVTLFMEEFFSRQHAVARRRTVRGRDVHADRGSRVVSARGLSRDAHAAHRHGALRSHFLERRNETP